ncbi:hypothetical protein PanWU01x14_371180 [Parasponia andersonii]|uniref:Uncharacterized protein n=1 Tax=Parasponia andersonii TaxID=3476 RepID=A0A2P5A449_PARAD|nr:hypothetical protein PanWU01x14_371180 [Parasponia andersonii]
MRWSDSIDPGCRLLTNEPAAWTELVLWTSDITSRKRQRYSHRDSFAACSKRSRSHMFVLPDRRGSGCDGSRVSYPTLPSSLASSRGAYLLGFHGVFHPLPPGFGRVTTGFVVPPTSAIRIGWGLLHAVDFRILVGLLRRNLPSAGSCLHSPATLQGERYLCVPLRPRPLNLGWPCGLSLPSGLLLLGRQASDLAFALDPVVLLGSSLRRRDVCSWLSFLRVPSDIVWLFIQGECGRESPTLFLMLNLLPTDGAKLLEQFLTSRPRVSEPLVLYSPTVHMSSLSQNILNSKQGWKGRSGYLQRLSDA